MRLPGARSNPRGDGVEEPNPPSTEAPIQRDDVFRRDGHTCVYCRRSAPDVELSVDHVEPRVKGGDNSRGNLVTACTDCNREKGPLPAWAWLADRPGPRASFLEHAPYVWPRLRDAVREAADRKASSLP